MNCRYDIADGKDKIQSHIIGVGYARIVNKPEDDRRDS